MTRRRRRPPRQLEPKAIKASYYAALRAILRDARAHVKTYVIDELPNLVRQAQLEHGDSIRHDAVSKKAKDAIEAARKAFEAKHPASELERLSKRMAVQTSGFHKKQLERQLNDALGIDVLAAEPRIRPRMENFAERNVSLITGSVLRPYFGEIENITLRTLSTGERWEVIAEELEDRFPMSESRARLIARDQVGKLYAELNQVRQQGLGLGTYLWRTVQDGRVREEHEEREGQVFKWESPPSDGHPGEPILCRCWAEPNVAEAFDE